MRIKWFGWDSFLIEGSGKKIYLDLLFDGEEVGNFILVSHGHGDHSDLEKINKIRGEETVVLTSEENASRIDGVGMKAGDVREFGDVKIRAVEAYNLKRERAPGVPYHPKGYGVGFLIGVEGKTVYFPGDSEVIPEMDELAGKVDVLLLPVSGVYVMDVDEGVSLVEKLKPKIVIPMHYGEVDSSLGRIELDIDLEDFRDKVSGFARVEILEKGGELILN